MGRGVVWWALALATVALVLLGLLPALADAPPQQLIKPVAKCDEKECVISRKDWEMFQEFHVTKFREIEWTNAILEQAQQEIAKLRFLLTRLGGNCGDKRKT